MNEKEIPESDEEEGTAATWFLWLCALLGVGFWILVGWEMCFPIINGERIYQPEKLPIFLALSVLIPLIALLLRGHVRISEEDQKRLDESEKK